MLNESLLVWFEKSGLKAIFKYNLPNDIILLELEGQETYLVLLVDSIWNQLTQADPNWPEADSSFFRLVSLVTYIFAFSLSWYLFGNWCINSIWITNARYQLSPSSICLFLRQKSSKLDSINKICTAWKIFLTDWVAALKCWIVSKFLHVVGCPAIIKEISE